MNLFWNGSTSIFFQDSTLKDHAWRVDPVTRERIGLVVRDDPMPPSYQTALKPKTLVDRVQFGDGYEQVTESGIRSQQLIYAVRWSNITDKKAIAMQRFLRGEGENSIYFRRPSEWFWWLPPKTLQTPNMRPVKVLCLDAWTITPTTYNSNSVDATFSESFSP